MKKTICDICEGLITKENFVSIIPVYRNVGGNSNIQINFTTRLSSGIMSVPSDVCFYCQLKYIKEWLDSME